MVTMPGLLDEGDDRPDDEMPDPAAEDIQAVQAAGIVIGASPASIAAAVAALDELEVAEAVALLEPQ